MKRPSPLAIVCVGVFFTSFSSIFVRGTGAPAVATAMYRMWFSVFLLLPIFITRRLSGRHTRKRRPDDANPQPVPRLSDWALCILSGVFLALHFWIWFESLWLTSIAASTVLVDTHPLFTLFFGMLFLKEKVRRRAVIYILVALSGIAILSFGDLSHESRESFTGNILALTSAIAVSGYILIGRRVRQRMDALTYPIVVYFVASVSLTVIALASGVSLFAYGLSDYLLFIGLALICTILGHTLFNWALKFLKAASLSMMIIAEPLFATILGMLIFKEIPGSSTAVGSVVILFGLFMFVREESRTKGAA